MQRASVIQLSYFDDSLQKSIGKPENSEKIGVYHKDPGLNETRPKCTLLEGRKKAAGRFEKFLELWLDIPNRK